MKRKDLSVKMLFGELEETKVNTRVTMYKRRHQGDLKKVLRETAMLCKPCEFQFNHYAIKYTTKDEYGCLFLRWEVFDALTGKKKEFFNKDFVSKHGNILWGKLAMEMKKV